MDMKSAYDIVCFNNPEMRPVSAVELERYYSFNMVPRTLAKGDGFANSSVYLVDKNTGESACVYFMLVANEPILQRYEF